MVAAPLEAPPVALGLPVLAERVALPLGPEEPEALLVTEALLPLAVDEAAPETVTASVKSAEDAVLTQLLDAADEGA